MISIVYYFWFRATLKITDSYRRGMNFANKAMGKPWESYGKVIGVGENLS
jgi:hypothetical protein